MPARRLIRFALLLSLASQSAVAAMAAEPPAESPPDPRDEQIRLLRQELRRLRERVEVLEARAAEPAPTPPPALAAPEAPETRATAYAGGSGAEAKAENPALAEDTADEPKIDFKGAVRFNTSWVSDNPELDDKRGQSGLDLFRIGAEGEYKDLRVSAEYRFYPFMNTIHHGWIGYRPNDRHAAEFGITQVPFGILPYASHNFWFGAPYYLGLGDDYDMGLKYRYGRDALDLQLAFFKNEELNDPANLDRYSFDVVQVGDQRNEETNQFNARLAYTFGEGTSFTNEVGLSGQWGQLYNDATGEHGDHWALAAHLDSRYERWNFQFQIARYAYNPENPPGVDSRSVRLGAFATSYDVAAEGTVLVGNVAYNFPVPVDFVDSITGYNDFSAVFKDEDAFDDSFLNTTGVAIGVGPVFIYLDLIQARNMVFFGDGSLAGGGDDEWDLRANLNVGYYW